MLPHIKHPTISILVIDQSPDLYQNVDEFCRKFLFGYRLIQSRSVTDAIKLNEHDFFNLIIIDSLVFDREASNLVGALEKENSCQELILVGAPLDPTLINNTVVGASASLVTKSFDNCEFHKTLRQVLDRCIEGSGKRSTQYSPRDKPDSGLPPRTVGKMKATAANRSVCGKLLWQSPAMEKLVDILDKIARTDTSVLITGETGTGKELIGREIHKRGRRREAPFVDVNCSAIPDSLFESEMFGHQRGTFTGAHETRRGLFEEAAGGTLFLDEVDALSLAAQAKLLRVLQQRHLRRVGGRENIAVDVRILSATNQNLQQAVSQGNFRADLLFRLRVFPLHVPALRNRGEDVKFLAEHLLLRQTTKRGLLPHTFAAEAMRAMMEYDWPGNVRELENAIEFALAIGMSEVIDVDDLPPDIARNTVPADVKLFTECLSNHAPLAEVEQRYIRAMLKEFNGQQIKTAEALGIDRRTLHRKLHAHN
jgi:DNA-binding NtrC family response regulator